MGVGVVAVENYRSLRSLTLALHPLEVVGGANGSGKSSLYRALRLLAATARGDVAAALAAEGGFASTLWAGPEKATTRAQGTVRTGPVRLRLGFGPTAPDGFGYLVELGLPVPAGSMFDGDPEVKREVVWSGPQLRPSTLLVEREGPLARARDEDGRWVELARGMRPYDGVLTELADPGRAPELLAVREQVRSWRFYDGFRTDAAAPARRPALGTRTPVLSDDGRDLAAAIRTIQEIGDDVALDRTVADAFGGASVSVAADLGRFGLQFHQPGLLRALTAAELSDGTLRYLLLTAALLTPRPPELMVLNEPETSLHPDLLPALARLLAEASRRTQLVVVSHSGALVRALAEEAPRAHRTELLKVSDATTVEGQGPLDGPAWRW